MPPRLVELAQGPPSKERWAQLFVAICDWQADEAGSDLLLARTEEALQVWPDLLRAAVLSENEQPEEDAWMWPIDPCMAGAAWLCLIRHIVASADEISAVPRGSEVERLVFPAVRSIRLRHKLASFQEAADAVARFPLVRSVDLSSVIFYPPDSPGPRAGWLTFLSALAVLPVRELNICRARLGLDALVQLVVSPVATVLESLYVSAMRPPLGPEGARVLATWPATSNLDTLSCAENGLGDLGAATLGDSGLLDRTRRLDLSRNGLTDVFLRSLLDQPNAVAFRVLRLGGARLSGTGLESLGAGKRLSDGCVLDLSDCKLTDDQVDVLLGDRLVCSVAELDLRANRLTDRSVERLVATRFAKLQLLRLEKNRLTGAGATEVERWAKQQGLTCTTRPLR